MLPNIDKYMQISLNLINNISFTELLFIVFLVFSLILIFRGIFIFIKYKLKTKETSDMVLEVVYFRKQSDAILLIGFGLLLLSASILHLLLQ